MNPSDNIGRSNLALVTVAGGQRFGDDFTRACVDSWSRLADVSATRWMVNGGLSQEGYSFARDRGFQVSEKDSEIIQDAVENRPGIKFMRRKLYTWRHIIDGIILCSDATHVVFIDTDVFITRRVRIAMDRCDYIYNCDDIPGYRGHWTLALREKLVPSLNPGFMIIRPSAVNLDLLDRLILDYFMNQVETFWWTRQAALAVLVGNSQHAEIFDGEDVRVFSGNRKRSPREIRKNKWKYLGDSRPMSDPIIARECIAGASVLHLAGQGKRWLPIAQEYADDSSQPFVLRSSPSVVANPWQSLLIGLRLFLLQSNRLNSVRKGMGRVL